MSIRILAATLAMGLLLAPLGAWACGCGSHSSGKSGYRSEGQPSRGYRAMADTDSEANDNDRDDQYERAEAYGEGVVAGYFGTQSGSVTSDIDAERQADYDRIFGPGDSAANNRWNEDRERKGDRDQAGKPNGDWNWGEGKCYTR